MTTYSVVASRYGGDRKIIATGLSLREALEKAQARDNLQAVVLIQEQD